MAKKRNTQKDYKGKGKMKYGLSDGDDASSVDSVVISDKDNGAAG